MGRRLGLMRLVARRRKQNSVSQRQHQRTPVIPTPRNVSSICSSLNSGSTELAKPNYQFDKRQEELARKHKQEQKRLRKQAENAFITPAVRVDKDAEATKT